MEAASSSSSSSSSSSLYPPPPSTLLYFPPTNSYPSPSSSSSSGGANFPILAIAIIGILATAFLLVGYYIFVIKCCLNWHRIDILHRFSLSPPRHHRSSSTSPSASSDYQTPDTSSKGLDEALIRLIPVIRFRKDVDTDAARGGARNQQDEHQHQLECAVCLSEFREGEKLRVIPNCCHAFHIDCIDVWLQTNANCPLCRSTISPTSFSSIGTVVLPRMNDNNNNNNALLPQESSSTGSRNDINGDDDDDDYVVIEIRDNNLDHPRLVPRRTNTNGSREVPRPNLKKVKSMDDECVDVIKKRVKDERRLHHVVAAVNDDDKLSIIGGVVQPFRRSISLDLTSQRQLWSDVREIIADRKQEVVCSSSGGGASGSGRVRRSFFSFGNGRAGSTVSPL